jgi:hypothetical protein
MRNGFESGFVLGNSSGPKTGLHSGLQSSNVMNNRINMLDPSTIIEPKLKPVFYINADNVALVSGAVNLTYNLIKGNSLAGSLSDLLPNYSLPFDQTAGTTYRPPLVLKGLNGRNYMNFADTGNRYLSSSTSINMFLYNNGAVGAKATGTGMTWMFIIKRKQGGLYNILDARDSSTTATTNDLLLEVNAAGAITFDYCGGSAGLVTNITGTSGTNLLNDWSILTVKCQLRKDGGAIPADNVLPATTKRYAMPSGAKIGTSSPIDIFVNGVEQPKNITTNTFTNADFNSDGSYRMFDRDCWIGNKGSVFANSGTHIAAAMMIPAYIDKAYQQRLENYFRWYYSLPF